MARAIIQLLEVVEVQHNDSERVLIPDRPAEFAFQRLFHVASIEQTGERVADSLDAQRLAQFQVPQSKPNLSGHGDGKPLLSLDLAFVNVRWLVRQPRGHL